LTLLQRDIRSAVEEAVYVVLGGPTSAAHALKVSNATIHEVIARGYIKRRDTAIEWEEATAKAGSCIPAAELLAVLPWLPESRRRGGHVRPAAYGRLPLRAVPGRMEAGYAATQPAVHFRYLDAGAPGVYVDPDDPLYTPQRLVQEQMEAIGPRPVRKIQRRKKSVAAKAALKAIAKARGQKTQRGRGAKAKSGNVSSR
jgi:hypothetical protein